MVHSAETGDPECAGNIGRTVSSSISIVVRRICEDSRIVWESVLEGVRAPLRSRCKKTTLRTIVL